MGSEWGWTTAEDAWNEVRKLSPVHAGMSYARLEELGGIQWPCYDETHPGEVFLHSRLWEDPVPGNRVPFQAVDHDPPVDKLSDDYPMTGPAGTLDALRAKRAVRRRRLELSPGEYMLEAVALDLRHRYLLRFDPGAPAPGWRPLEVKLKHTHADLRYRPGYMRRPNP